MPEPLLVARGVAVSIRAREVVSDATLDVAKGECVGLVGETGSGKSVTCRSIVGLLGRIDGQVTRGSLRFADVDLLTAGRQSWQQIRGKQIGYVPQASLSSLNPVRTVGSQILETLRQLKGPSQGRAEAIDLLERVQLSRPAEALDLYPHQLSGGMKQRVMIGLAIAGDPGLLVADEPTTALDVTIQREILDLLTTLRQRLDMAVLLVTHDLGVVSAMTDRVVIMYAGTTVESGPTAGVLRAPEHPYTSALLQARPTPGDRTRLKALAGAPPAPQAWARGCRFAGRCPLQVDACLEALPDAVARPGERSVRCFRAGERVEVGADD